MKLAADTMIDGRYRVIDRIGSGGMADVFSAEDTHLGRTVALKILHSRFAEDREFVERFRREASSAAGLQHPNVVGVYDRGRYEDTYYIAMEHLEGRTLKEVIEAGEVDIERALAFIREILAAARFAHKRGVIHRDLKPQNVIVDPDGRAKVTDFGIARAGASDMTQTGSVLGTAHYLSPEQAQGLEVTAASDLYSVGVILYEALTGQLPFEGDSAVAIALKQVSENPSPPSELNPQVPPQLDAVVMRALAKDPERRFQSADEMLSELDAVAAGQPIGQHTAAWEEGLQPVEERESRWPRRRWILLGAVLLLLGVLAVAVVSLLTGPDDVRVPSVVGLQVSEATDRLQDRGLEVEVRTIDSNREQGIVLEQDPIPGSTRQEDSEVTLTVSRGPPSVEVPSVRGLSQRQAIARLEDAGFEDVEVERRFDDEVASGRAIGTDPERGEEILRTSQVTLFVSRGVEMVSVPGVVGLSQSAAEAEVRNARLVPRVTESEDEARAGEVISQDPSSGERLEPGSTVTLVVSTGPSEAEVPDVVGRSRGLATEILSREGFSVTVRPRTVRDRREDMIVLEQSPSGGSTRSEGATVIIVVGSFEAPEGRSPAPDRLPPPEVID